MKPRIKTGHLPGDVSKHVKEAMLEGRWPNRARAKTFKKVVRMNERAVLKERTKSEIEKELGQ